MNVDIIAAVLSIVLLTLLNALFTLAKTSLVSVRHAGLAHAISEAGDANTATHVQRLLKQPARVFATLQVCLTLSSFTASAIAGSVLAPNLEIQLLPLHLPH